MLFRSDKEQLLKENNETKQMIEELKIQIEDIVKQNNNLQLKETEINTLLIINKKLLDDVDYYKTSNFSSYIEQANKFIINIYNNSNKYIPKIITENRYYQLYKVNIQLEYLIVYLKKFTLI